jgi:hypothetical protein
MIKKSLEWSKSENWSGSRNAQNGFFAMTPKDVDGIGDFFRNFSFFAKGSKNGSKPDSKKGPKLIKK